MDKVLIIVGDATETVDTLYPFLRIQEDGFTPVVAGPDKRRYQMVLHEISPGWDITEEWKGYSINADIAFRDIDPPNTSASSSLAVAPPNTFATTPTSFASRAISLNTTNPLPASVTALKSRVAQAWLKDVAWPAFGNANLTSKSAAASLSMNRASSMAIWSAVACGTTTGSI